MAKRKKDDIQVDKNPVVPPQFDKYQNTKTMSALTVATATSPRQCYLPSNHANSPNIGLLTPLEASYYCKSRLTLSNLPKDIHRLIFDHLCPVSSTCLGLTSKTFYPTHFSLHGKVDLQSYSDETYFGNCRAPPHMLYRYLRKWMEPDYVWFPYGDGMGASKFVEVEKMVESKRRRMRGVWRKRRGSELWPAYLGSFEVLSWLNCFS